MSVSRGVDQLHRDPDPIAGALHAAFQDSIDAEFFADLAARELRIAELLARCARDDFHRADLGELRQDIVVNAVDEEDIRMLVAAVLERQYSDGGTCVGGRGGCRLRIRGCGHWRSGFVRRGR
ncbi:MAG: hypothetical protein NTU56_14475 [Proteobacteria bacterium]|nr:hypothetical protein [Pseudomonadota bacterium]